MAAIISDDGVYRYWLRRELPLQLGAAEDTCVFIMLNPSTADAEHDDPTIRRCMGFAEALGCSALEVVNLYAHRATDPEVLLRAGRRGVDIVGPDTEANIEAAAARGRYVIAAWGANAPLPRVADVLGIPGPAMAELFCLGTTDSGAPRHPLYVRADKQIEPWRPNT